MGENKVNELDQLSDSMYQNDLSDLERSLKGMKNELEQGNNQNNLPEQSLAMLTQKIALFVGKEGLLKREGLAGRPELVELMHEIIRNIQGPKGGRVEDAEFVSLSEGKRLLLELMYGIVADVGRKLNETEVTGLADRARNFFDYMGLGRLYTTLLNKANTE